MKKDILKIAGVKSEKEFYKKFPTEEAFMKAHGKEFKKAKMGASMVKKQLTQLTDFSNPPETNSGYKIKRAQVGIAQTKANDYGDNFYENYLVQNQEDYSQMDADAEKAAQEQIAKTQQWANNLSKTSKEKTEKEKTPFKTDDYMSSITGIAQGLAMIPEEVKMNKRAKTAGKLADLQGQALDSQRNQKIKRKYLTPWDNPVQPGQLGNPYGTRYEILNAQDGASLSNRVIGGVPGEIMNTYDPNTIYSDLGYEPLEDSEKVKQFQQGGFVKGLGDFASAGGIEIGSQLGTLAGSYLGGGKGKPSAGSSIGGGIGTAAGMAIGGPIGGMIGGALGSAVGGLIDPTARNQEKAQRKMDSLAGQQSIGAFQKQYASSFKDGGQLSDYEWVSHTWQPQVIAKFGDHNVSDLLKPDPTMNTLRTGGNIRQNNMSELDRYAFGGELKTHWGGYAEPISENPYLPGTGETVMFRGQSHDESDGNGNTGIGVTYGQPDSYTDYAEYGSNVADVEVERNEPAVELPDSEGGNNMVVYGNLKIPNQFLHLLDDPKAKGKKFKSYVKDLAKVETRQNNIVEKSSEELDNLNVQNPFDKLKMSALQASIMGANMKLKEAANKKMKAANLQNAINDTAEELGLDADHLSKGKVMMAKQGASIPKAQTGIALPKMSKQDYLRLKGLYDIAMRQKRGEAVENFQKEFHRIAPDYAKQVIGSEPLTNYGKKMKLTLKDLASNEDAIFGKRTARYMGQVKVDNTPVEIPEIYDTPKKTPKDKVDVTPYERNKWVDVFNQVLPYIRPSDAEALDPRQLTGEMFALGTNVLEPVQAQTYQPELATPTSISYQDAINANQADYNATQRLVGYNPAALSALNAQKYEANQRVLGEQFRANQAEKQRVYDANRAILNDAKLKNLGILDQQYTRQQQAMSNTKATTLEALKSIGSKYAQNDLANKTLQTYENLYDYRFGPGMRAINMNELQQFQPPVIYTPEDEKNAYVRGEQKRFEDNIAHLKPSTDLTEVKPNIQLPADINQRQANFMQMIEQQAPKASKPAPIKSKKKTGRNGSIVQAIKNL